MNTVKHLSIKEASEPPGQNESQGQNEPPGHNEPLEHPPEEHDVPMAEPTNVGEVNDPSQLPPVPEDQDLDEPQPHVPPSVAEPDPDPEWELDPLYAQPAGSQETFEERRRRFDQQETIQARRVHPVVLITEPAEERRNKRIRRPQEEDLPVDTDLLALNDTKDVNSLNNLVEGWTFDKATGEFVLGETKDYWSFEDGFLVRNHVWSRNSTFTSDEAPLPIAADELQSTTGLTLPNGSRQVFVNNAQTYSIGKDQWVGKTLFPLTKRSSTQPTPAICW